MISSLTSIIYQVIKASIVIVRVVMREQKSHSASDPVSLSFFF